MDAVVRLHQLRNADFRRGCRLGGKDHVVAWPKPAQPQWMDDDTYTQLPDWLVVREVAVRVEQNGFRTRALTVVTTLVDAVSYPAGELAELYRARWHAELDLRSLKITMSMDVLRCKTPGMVRKELWAHLLAYNLIRTVMAQAALDLEISPRQLSFKGAQQALNAFADRLLQANASTAVDLRDWLWLMIGTYQVGDRPDRIEPRARKRRPKDYPNLHQPRYQARNFTYAKT